MQPQLRIQSGKESERKGDERAPINFSLQSKSVEHMKTTTETGQSGSCCALGNHDWWAAPEQEVRTFYHSTWKASLGHAHWLCQDQLPETLSSIGNRGSPAHQYSAHILTACAGKSNHFSAPFRFYLFVIFPHGWKDFSFILGRDTNLTIYQKLFQ